MKAAGKELLRYLTGDGDLDPDRLDKLSTIDVSGFHYSLFYIGFCDV